MISKPATPFRYPIKIRAEDIDEMGHVNNAVHLVWVQASVLAHWYARATPEAARLYRWIAVRHEITYRKPVLLDYAPVATVVLQKVRRESAFYETQISHCDAVLAEITSRWCCIDALTQRPTRLPDDVIASFESDHVQS